MMETYQEVYIKQNLFRNLTSEVECHETTRSIYVQMYKKNALTDFMSRAKISNISIESIIELERNYIDQTTPSYLKLRLCTCESSVVCISMVVYCCTRIHSRLRQLFNKPEEPVPPPWKSDITWDVK